MCVADGWEIPPRITIDLKDCKANQIIRLTDISLPPGISPAREVAADFVIATISSGKG